MEPAEEGKESNPTRETKKECLEIGELGEYAVKEAKIAVYFKEWSLLLNKTMVLKMWSPSRNICVT